MVEGWSFIGNNVIWPVITRLGLVCTILCPTTLFTEVIEVCAGCKESVEITDMLVIEKLLKQQIYNCCKESVTDMPVADEKRYCDKRYACFRETI